VAGLDEKAGRKAADGLVFGSGDLDRLLTVAVAAFAEHDILGVDCPVSGQVLDLLVDLAEQRLAKIHLVCLPGGVLLS